MAEEHGRSGGNYGNRKSYGSGRSGNGSGRSFGGSRSGSRGGYRGGKSGGFHKDGGFRKNGHRDGEGFRRDHEGAGEGREFRRDFQRDGERGGYRGRSHDGMNKGGFRRDDDRRGGRHFHRDNDRRDFRRDGERNDRGGFRRDDRKDDRRDFRRDGDNPRYQRNDRGGDRGGFRRDDDRRGGRDFRRDNDRRDFHRDNRRDDRRDNRREDRRGDNATERREFTPQEKRDYRETKRREYMERGPRRNSDGTMSFPSQNPYTARRPDEPKMPKGMEWNMLSKDERERLRGLSKEHAENIGLHILAAYALEEKDPKDALAHAKWVARQASRIDFARETLAFIAYRQGDYKLALREFRTAYRMNGYLDYLPFIADCERGNGEPRKAIEVVLSDDAKALRGEAKAEMFLVYAGALADLKQWDKAIDIVHTLGRSKGLTGEYRMRAVQAEQYFLEESGRNEDAAKLDTLLDKLELQYADEDEDEASDDVIIDHDLERFSDDELDMLGISEDDAQYAPDNYGDTGKDAQSDDDNESDDAEDTDDADDESANAPAVVENDEQPAQSAGDDPAADEEELPAQEAQDGVDSVIEPAGDGIDDAADESDAADTEAEGEAE